MCLDTNLDIVIGIENIGIGTLEFVGIGKKTSLKISMKHGNKKSLTLALGREVHLWIFGKCPGLIPGSTVGEILLIGKGFEIPSSPF